MWIENEEGALESNWETVELPGVSWRRFSVIRFPTKRRGLVGIFGAM